MVKIVCRLKKTWEIEGLLIGLMLADMAQLRKSRGKIPSLYMSGVRYKREPEGEENWQTAEECVRLGYGDCEDLAAWRAAELRVSGQDPLARAVLREVRPGLMHCLVMRANGQLEDPSKKLGMGGEA